MAIQCEVEARAFRAPRLSRAWPRYAPWEVPETKDLAWGFLIDLVNAALVSSSSLSLAWVRDDEVVSGEEHSFRAGPPLAPVISTPETLYGVCGLELADHVLAGHNYRVCANETCGRLFSAQEGTSRYGTHRTDNLKFHTRACKDAQAAREYRRRKGAGSVTPQRKGKRS